MQKDNIAGMAVGVVEDGKTYVFDYGVASRATRTLVTRKTLFELGSVSKTLTATLVSYAQVTGRLSLSDKTGKYLPSLAGCKFGNVSLLNLGTHTPGGLPLQVPDNIKNNDQLMNYLKQWRPTYAPGTYRTYSNISIGLLGVITAKSMDQNFAQLMNKCVFSPLGMKNSYYNIPADRQADYAEGYTKDGKPIRMAAGVLSSEAYGIKTTASDMTRFVEANMNLMQLDQKLNRATTNTHTGYFRAKPMTQDLIWEQYPYPVALQALWNGDSSAMAYNAIPVVAIKPLEEPRKDVWINKSGSTNGFGAYVAFIPEKRLGIVILANKNYPINDRVTIAYRVLTRLGEISAHGRIRQKDSARSMDK